MIEVPKHESDISLSDMRLAVDDEDHNFVTPSVYVVDCNMACNACLRRSRTRGLRFLGCVKELKAN